MLMGKFIPGNEADLASWFQNLYLLGAFRTKPLSAWQHARQNLV